MFPDSESAAATGTAAAGIVPAAAVPKCGWLPRPQGPSPRLALKSGYLL
ncbi:MAG: hypothetical protein ACOX1X_07080 [Dethiobacteria bacterium]